MRTDPDITWVGMTRPHYQAGRPGPIRALVIHATAGRGPGDLLWLRQGGTVESPVSAHYYVDKAGRISQLVRDADTAWHAGVSRWAIDGRVVEGLNPVAIGVELENLNTGRDPYPAAQVAAAVALARSLVARYAIPQAQLVRHLDISPGRKSDPAGLLWEPFVAAVYRPGAPITPDSPILGPTPDAPRLAGSVFARCAASPYAREAEDPIRRAIVPCYVRLCAQCGVDAWLALAQLCHETANLTSWWAQRPRRNPAGIGVTGARRPPTAPTPSGWARDGDELVEGLSFASWDMAALAHVGRLVAYATPPTGRTAGQQDLARVALRLRPLPDGHEGAAPTLGALGGRWAADLGYGAKLARVANELRGAD